MNAFCFYLCFTQTFVESIRAVCRHSWMLSTAYKPVQVQVSVVGTYTGLVRADPAGCSHTQLSPARWIKLDPTVSYSPHHHLWTGEHKTEQSWMLETDCEIQLVLGWKMQENMSLILQKDLFQWNLYISMFR